MNYRLLAAAISLIPVSGYAQIADVSVEIVEHFPDTTVRIVEHFEDERWQVAGECSSMPSMAIEIVDHFEELKVRIVEHFPDRIICITNADELNDDQRRALNLVE